MPQNRKRDIRREMRLILSNLDERWQAAAHPEVCGHLSHLVKTLAPQSLIASAVAGGSARMQRGSARASAVEHVLAWYPGFPGEVDLSEFIAEMLRSRSVYLPRMESDGAMTFIRISEDWISHLVEGTTGILQPESDYGEPFNPETAENVVVVLPGLAYDRRGRRLGRGGGYYDRFLSNPLLESSVKIGVCWSLQVVPEIPTDIHDISMHWLCHERGVIEVEE